MASNSLRRCPDCGEAYSSSYKRCPFCEEDAAMMEGEYIRRSSRQRGRRTQRSTYSLVTPTLILLILVMAALLVYLLFGDRLTKKPGKEEAPTPPPASSIVTPPSVSTPVTPPASSENPSASTPGTMPEDPEITDPVLPTVPYDTAYALPSGLTLNKTDYTTNTSENPVQLTVSGGSGNYTWVSQDPYVATVDANGKVKAVGGGTVNIVVSDGSRKGVCIVRVRGAEANRNDDPPTASNLSLNKTDYTTYVGEMDVLLTLGVTNGVTWETSDASVATVNKGLVHAVGKGTCTITATFDGHTHKCIVRVTR